MKSRVTGISEVKFRLDIYTKKTGSTYYLNLDHNPTMARDAP